MTEMPSTPPDLAGRVDSLRQSNTERAKKLALEGVQISPLSELLVLLGHLVDREIQRDPEFELTLERAREELLVVAEQHVARAKLEVVPGGEQLSFGDAAISAAT